MEENQTIASTFQNYSVSTRSLARHSLLFAREVKGFMLSEAFVKKYLQCPICCSHTLSLELPQSLKKGMSYSWNILCCACGKKFPVKEGIAYLCSDALRRFVESGKKMSKEEIYNAKKDAKMLKQHVTFANIDYHNRIARYYEKDISTWGIINKGSPTQSRIAEMSDYFSQRTDKDLWIDVGCGTGNVLNHASKKFKYTIGVDVATEMLKIAINRHYMAIFADAADLPFQEKTADVISAISLVHHLKDPTDFFKAAYRVLKPGGYIYTDWDPNMQAYSLCGPYSKSYLFRHLRPMARNIIARLHGLHIEQHKKEHEAIAMLAEYHHNIKMGLDPHVLVDNIRRIGFKDIKIYFHDNPRSLFAPFKIRLLTRLAFFLQGEMSISDPTKYAPVFAILARKSLAL